MGDVLIDRFVEGRVSRISREAPVPVLKFGTARDLLGGACNVAANLLAFGGTVTLVGLIGIDAAAEEMIDLCRRFPHLTPLLIRDPGRPTTVKTRFLSAWQQLLCVDTEFTAPAPAETRAELVAAAEQALPSVDILVLSDYGRGVLDPTTVAALIKAARAAGRKVVVDPRKPDAAAYAGAHLVTPNVQEMFAFTGIRVDSDETAAAACAQILERVAIDAVLLTRGEAGMTLLERGAKPLHIRAETHRVFDVTGAGDTVIATLAAAMAVGIPLSDAIRIANTAAGIVVTKPGTATVSPHELRQAFGAVRAGGVVERTEAAETAALWKDQGLKVGFTNGCFDLIHRGHLHSLEQAARRVDRLIVGVNSDASARRLKGPDRPVQDAATRSAVLSALRFVDLVVVFEEDTPEALIQALEPDILFKGTDYREDQVPGGDFVKARGGRVELLPLLPGHSTTGTVNRVRADPEA